MAQVEQSSVQNATKATFDELVLKTDATVVVDFWAPWCGACRKLAPVYDELSVKYARDLTFVKVNVEDERGLSERYGISSLPTLKFFCAGREIGEHIGAAPRDKLDVKLQEVLDEAQDCLAASSPARK